MYRWLKHMNREDPVTESRRTRMEREKIPHDLLPCRLDLFFLYPGLKSKFAQNLPYRLASEFRSVLGKGFLWKSAPLGNDPRFQAGCHSTRVCPKPVASQKKKPSSEKSERAFFRNHSAIAGAQAGRCVGIRCYSPSLPMASTGQPSIASLQSASSSGDSGCLKTKEWPPSSSRLKFAGAVSRQRSQSMH